MALSPWEHGFPSRLVDVVQDARWEELFELLAGLIDCLQEANFFVARIGIEEVHDIASIRSFAVFQKFERDRAAVLVFERVVELRDFCVC